MIISNADDGTFSNEFQYFVTAANGQETRRPLKKGEYAVIPRDALGPPPYSVLLDASPSFKVDGLPGGDFCITYYPPAGKALVTGE